MQQIEVTNMCEYVFNGNVNMIKAAFITTMNGE